jgi:hypothetical protein
MGKWEVLITCPADLWSLAFRIQPKGQVFVEFLSVEGALKLLRKMGFTTTWGSADELRELLIDATRAAPEERLQELARAIPKSSRKHLMERARHLSLDRASLWVRLVAPNRALKAITTDPAVAKLIGALPSGDFAPSMSEPPSALEMNVHLHEKNASERRPPADDLAPDALATPPLDPQIAPTDHSITPLDRQIAPAITPLDRQIAPAITPLDRQIAPAITPLIPQIAQTDPSINPLNRQIAPTHPATTPLDRQIAPTHPATTPLDRSCSAHEPQPPCDTRENMGFSTTLKGSSPAEVERVDQVEGTMTHEQMARLSSAQSAAAEQERQLDDRKRALDERERVLGEREREMNARANKEQARHKRLKKRKQEAEEMSQAAEDAKKEAKRMMDEAKRVMDDAERAIVDKHRNADLDIADKHREANRKIADKASEIESQLAALEKGKRALAEAEEVFYAYRRKFTDRDAALEANRQAQVERAFGLFGTPDPYEPVQAILSALQTHFLGSGGQATNDTNDTNHARDAKEGQK